MCPDFRKSCQLACNEQCQDSKGSVQVSVIFCDPSLLLQTVVGFIPGPVVELLLVVPQFWAVAAAAAVALLVAVVIAVLVVAAGLVTIESGVCCEVQPVLLKLTQLWLLLDLQAQQLGVDTPPWAALPPSGLPPRQRALPSGGRREAY